MVAFNIYYYVSYLFSKNTYYAPDTIQKTSQQPYDRGILTLQMTEWGKGEDKYFASGHRGGE